jgi:hypothetical protein
MIQTYIILIALFQIDVLEAVQQRRPPRQKLGKRGSGRITLWTTCIGTSGTDTCGTGTAVGATRSTESATGGTSAAAAGTGVFDLDEEVRVEQEKVNVAHEVGERAVIALFALMRLQRPVGADLCG